MNLTLKVEDFVWEPFFFVVPAFVVPCCFNERVPCSRPRMARSTRRSKPDQRGAETLGGLPAQLHAIRKVGFDQLVRENASKDTRRPVVLPVPPGGTGKPYLILRCRGSLRDRRRRPIVFVAPTLLLLAWNLARGSVVVDCGYSEATSTPSDSGSMRASWT